MNNGTLDSNAHTYPELTLRGVEWLALATSAQRENFAPLSGCLDRVGGLAANAPQAAGLPPKLIYLHPPVGLLIARAG